MTKPDTSKKTNNKVAKPPKKATPEPRPFDRDAEEAKLIAKYPKQRIVKGSLRDSGEVPEFGQKRTIEIICQGDGKTRRRIATSDLHQVFYSEEYMKQLRLERRKGQRSDKKAVKKAAAKTTKKPRAKKAEEPDSEPATVEITTE